MKVSRPVTTVIAVALLALGAISGAQSSALQSVVAVVVAGDSGWGSVKPPVALDQLPKPHPTDDSGWG
ncbi:hypothetical protein ACFY0P_38305 [Streptomyces sp. NPDC001714]|uniref:hypothetical protein n=1 Tax=Streptomyces sp. NPDC001714 TaxID=3364603 RepID=UPI0036A3D658